MFQTTVLATSYKLPLLYEVFKPDDEFATRCTALTLHHFTLTNTTIPVSECDIYVIEN